MITLTSLRSLPLTEDSTISFQETKGVGIVRFGDYQVWELRNTKDQRLCCPRK
jgi:hypothetical protein